LSIEAYIEQIAAELGSSFTVTRRSEEDAEFIDFSVVHAGRQKFVAQCRFDLTPDNIALAAKYAAAQLRIAFR